MALAMGIVFLSCSLYGTVSLTRLSPTLWNVTLQCLLQARKHHWRWLCDVALWKEHCKPNAGISEFYCTLPGDRTLPAQDKVIYFFSLLRKETRRNSMRADLGEKGVKSFSCSRKEQNFYSSTGKWQACHWWQQPTMRGETRFWWECA